MAAVLPAPRAQYHLLHCSLAHALGARSSTRCPPWLLLLVYVILAVGLSTLALLFVMDAVASGSVVRRQAPCVVDSKLSRASLWMALWLLGVGLAILLQIFVGCVYGICEGGLHVNWQVWMGTLSCAGGCVRATRPPYCRREKREKRWWWWWWWW